MAAYNNVNIGDELREQLTVEDVHILLREIGDEELNLMDYQILWLSLTPQYAQFRTGADFKKHAQKIITESKRLAHRTKVVLDLTGDSDMESDVDAPEPDPEIVRGDEAIEKLREMFAKYKKK